MIRGLRPISAKNARLLILGSMPSVKSLEKQQYYAHPQNAFWKIMLRLLGRATTYRQKERLLKKRRIALWDMIKMCERKGSLDTAIKNPEYNPIADFLKKHPKITRVLLNGGTAHSAYLFYAKGRIRLPHTRLPSTSPANTMKFELKLRAWKKALA
jgi:hypoxanthine-DNA glycosylase